MNTSTLEDRPKVLTRRAEAGLRPTPGLAADLTRQSLRFLYRIIVLLYAESRPELGVLPTDTPEYTEGYGLDRLRGLIQTPPLSERRPPARICTRAWRCCSTR